MIQINGHSNNAFGINVDFDLIRILTAVYANGQTEILLSHRKIGDIQINKGVRQGAITSPLLFNLIMDQLIKLLKTFHLGLSLQGC